jgi:N-formylglutamate amidohydrolase
MTNERGRWTFIDGGGPLVMTAIHDGQELSDRVMQGMALSAGQRLQEEDPFTGKWAEVSPTHIIAHRSRFEVDLNRPRERALYVEPADAWGLKVWKEPPHERLILWCTEEYNEFYRQARQFLDAIANREDYFVVLDLHSYCHRRGGADAPFDSQIKNPDINIGTGSLDQSLWRPIADHLISELRSCDTLGRVLDVRENVKFLGGNFSQWINAEYNGRGCAIALEFKKFFMNEWTGELYQDIHAIIRQLLEECSVSLVERIHKLNGHKMNG